MRSFLVGSCIVLLASAAVSFSVYRGILSKQAAITAKWNRVEVRLQERNAVIPLLEKKVYDYADHENALFSTLQEAESGWDKASGVDAKINAAAALDAALSHLLKTAENYSKLKSEPELTKLIRELAVREEIISSERELFNRTVREYNAMITIFPANLIASASGLKPLPEYNKIEHKAKTIGRIKL